MAVMQTSILSGSIRLINKVSPIASGIVPWGNPPCFIIYSVKFVNVLRAVYMEARLARLARQPGKRDEFLLCL